MNYICTWFCADEKGEESKFPQTGELSSSQKHQNIYWRCILTFFITSKKFNEGFGYVLFTNTNNIPTLDGLDVRKTLMDFGVEIVVTPFSYKTPANYYGEFRNQFYEFSILEYIVKTSKNDNDYYLILDSDCIFIKSVQPVFDAAVPNGFLSMEDTADPDYVINGLSKNDMAVIFEELLNKKIDAKPTYHEGEFLLCSVYNIKKICSDFLELWPILLKRNEQGLKKFNEEAHTLSYLYYKNELPAGGANRYSKRLWTNPVFYRNVEPSDLDLCIWHLPSEKTFGLADLYDILLKILPGYGLNLPNEEFLNILVKTFGIPHLTTRFKVKYYFWSYYRALRKRVMRKSFLSSLFNQNR